MVVERPCKKLIEVSIPLEAVNAAAAREKSIRHGHPSTLHLWWARRPLAACRAVLFAQLVDDPSCWPERFPTPEAQAAERDRLHGVIKRLVPWEASNDDAILHEARWEIARSVAWRRGDEPPPSSDPVAVRAYLRAHALPVYDPFCGGGSIPLEAQRLGLPALGSDLNPVAVLISKALVEIPPKFADQPPVNPQARARPDLVPGGWTGARGLAEDVRYYGRWMRKEAQRRIGHLYPKVSLPDGREATVVAWLWARTVRSPDPAARGAHVPLVSTFMLSTKRGKQSWIEPIVDRAARTWRFEVRTGVLTEEQRTPAKSGTKQSRGASFRCLLTGAPITAAWIKEEGRAGRMRSRLLAMVVEGSRERLYLAPSEPHEPATEIGDIVTTGINQAISENSRWFSPPDYGLPDHKDLFTPRQLAALTTFADLIGQARQEIERHARTAGLSAGGAPLHAGGTGATAYADAVATYLTFALSKLADRGSSICTWFTQRDSTRPTFARQAIPMTWDFAEPNPLLTGTGTYEGAIVWTAESLEGVPSQAHAGQVTAKNAMHCEHPACPVVISTDPPYYDNIGYADLSDFFYVWLRRSLGERDDRAAVWPELLRAPLTPKNDELVATPYRRGGKRAAEAFFIAGMGRALRAMHQAADDNAPLTIYYAFKQSESGKEGIASPGWASFLQAVVDSSLAVRGTWPLRTELGNRMTGMGANALASSIVLVCRKRPVGAEVVERETFVRVLRRELPSALAQIRAAGIGPLDMAQSAIGPGMGIFTRYAAVLEDSGQKMTVRTALGLINQIRDELDQDDDAAYDLPTRFALDWFEDAGWDARDSGDAILAANARNLGLDKLVRIGLIVTQSGTTRLTRRDEMPLRGAAASRPSTIWQAAQRLARALVAHDGGQEQAAAVMTRLADRESVRALAYRLYGICERKGWAAEALVWNRLAEDWRHIGERAEAAAPRTTRDLFELHA